METKVLGHVEWIGIIYARLEEWLIKYFAEERGFHVGRTVETISRLYKQNKGITSSSRTIEGRITGILGSLQLDYKGDWYFKINRGWIEGQIDWIGRKGELIPWWMYTKRWTNKLIGNKNQWIREWKFRN